MMSNRSRHVKLLKLAECVRSRKKNLKKDNTQVAVLKNLKMGNTAKSEISYKGLFPLAAQVPIPNKVCNLISQIQTNKVIESVKHKFIDQEIKEDS